MRHTITGAVLAFFAASAASVTAKTGHFDELIGWVVLAVGGAGALSMLFGWEHAHHGNAWAHTLIGLVLLLTGAGEVTALHLLHAFGWAAMYPALLAVLGIFSMLCGADSD